MSQVKIEAFVSIPPCSGGVAVKRLLSEIVAEFGDQVEVAFHIGPGDDEWEEYAITSAPALVVGDLVKFVGLAPSTSYCYQAQSSNAAATTPWTLSQTFTTLISEYRGYLPIVRWATSALYPISWSGGPS